MGFNQDRVRSRLGDTLSGTGDLSDRVFWTDSAPPVISNVGTAPDAVCGNGAYGTNTTSESVSVRCLFCHGRILVCDWSRYMCIVGGTTCLLFTWDSWPGHDYHFPSPEMVICVQFSRYMVRFSTGNTGR